jgi:hypothetical protein
MIVDRGDGSDRHGRLRRRLSQVTGLALGIAMLGTIGLSGALAQDDVAAGTDAESLVNAIIQQVFGEVFGDAMVADDAAVSGGGDINVGGNMGGSITMGGGSGGGVTMGGGTSGGVTVGDDSGG